jgi:N-acetylmuramoyl-L-alanine amidase
LEGGKSLKLYLDAGHGGKDSGASGNGLLEKNINLEICKRIKDYLKDYSNVEVMVTRDSDIFLTLDERTDHANKWGADAFLSVHINANTSPSPRGFESYTYPNANSATKAFQNVMHQEIFKQISSYGMPDKGKKTANFHVLRESEMKAILTENGFITNSADATLMKKADFLDKLALGHVIGLEKFFGLNKARPPSEVGLYQVIAGTYSQKSNADDLAKKLKADGYDAYVFKKE